ncbi:hypothetical protein RB195_017391 [Necator americanus]|uniref:Uncharacterized protein n=1 Tax=Necator americanus TaxID=51031 RepID=A0ABR1C509_NECAM
MLPLTPPTSAIRPGPTTIPTAVSTAPLRVQPLVQLSPVLHVDRTDPTIVTETADSINKDVIEDVLIDAISGFRNYSMFEKHHVLELTAACDAVLDTDLLT